MVQVPSHLSQHKLSNYAEVNGADFPFIYVNYFLFISVNAANPSFTHCVMN